MPSTRSSFVDRFAVGASLHAAIIVVFALGGSAAAQTKEAPPSKAMDSSKAAPQQKPGAPFRDNPAAKSAGSAIPGGIVRWSETGTRSCRMGKRSWPALGETCYYPIDIMQKPGVITVTRVGAGKSESAKVQVDAFDYGVQEVELPDIPQRDPSPADLKRVAREGQLLAKLWQRREGPRQFTLPLGPPAKPLPTGKAFGAGRVFNGKPASQPHMGTDYPIGPGNPIIAVADGTVALAEDLFNPGNAVFIDHGDGLISESFHLSEMSVKAGDMVKKGDVIGKVGSTGRSTGPHLFFGVRWHGARINPRFLLEDPSRITPVR
jgi:hypothetical protein